MRFLTHPVTVSRVATVTQVGAKAYDAKKTRVLQQGVICGATDLEDVNYD